MKLEIEKLIKSKVSRRKDQLLGKSQWNLKKYVSQEKISETKHQFFGKINKIISLQLGKEKKEHKLLKSEMKEKSSLQIPWTLKVKVNSMNISIPTELITQIKGVNSLKDSLPKLTQGEIDNLNRFISTTEI